MLSTKFLFWQAVVVNLLISLFFMAMRSQDGVPFLDSLGKFIFAFLAGTALSFGFAYALFGNLDRQ